jgi:nucleolar protein TMA23
MNAHALLTSQGWRGHGHSLHKTDDKIGLAKPLLLNRKSNTFGISEKNHFTSDQWWMNAFDEQLKGLETTKGGVKQIITTGKLNAIEKGSLGKYSLYTSFVRGGLLEGTLQGLEESTTETNSEEEEVQKKETKEERRARKEAKRQRKEQRALRRAARAAKRAAKESRRSSSSDDKKRGKKDRAEKSSSSEDDKTEEKKRRRAKKEEKRRKRAMEASA